jgi:solute:Na+ symporter, SSS family
MNWLDWLVLSSTLLFIVVYGIWKSKGDKDIEGYLKGGNSIPWYSVGLSIMATQASAITFLSAPGQAFTDGMRFVQFYFGLPLAMIVLCISVVPIYKKLNVYTAYEYLESRFDLKTRALGAFLFLTQRGIAAGLTIYAPSIILSSILGWNIYITNIVIGGIVILYTVAGGSKAVSYTQMHQMVVILGGMLIAGIVMFMMLPDDVTFTDTMHLAGKAGKLNVIDLNFDLDNKYNVWSGLIGGFFLALSYFGTDQSQVARYLSGKSIAESRLGLLFNGLLKIPMQFLILLIGAIMYVFFIYTTPPIFFNKVETDAIKNSQYAADFKHLEDEYLALAEQKKTIADNVILGTRTKSPNLTEKAAEKLTEIQLLMNQKRNVLKGLMQENNPKADTNDTNYIFLYFITTYLPAGIIGLLIAVIFSASMSSTSSELNALAGTTIIDIYKRMVKKDGSDSHYLWVSKFATLLWGIYAILIAQFANQLGSLIEAVNILGSLFYGTILGIFLVGFYLKNIKGASAFYAALVSQTTVLLLYKFTEITFLWYNLIGCVIVISGAYLLNFIIPKTEDN